MNNNLKKLFGGAGILALAASVVSGISYYTTKKFVEVALEREMPKGIIKHSSKKISGMDDDVFEDEEIIELTKKLENFPHETIEIIADDETKLMGHYFKCENEKRLIIAMHGWRSSWARDFCGIWDFWMENGSSVIFPEQRAQNNSGGEYMGFGMLERHDCISWIKWANENGFNETPIYLAGLSMGATTVLMTAGLNPPSNVRGIMADCGFTSAHEIWKHVAENNLHLSYDLLGKIANDMCKRRINIGTTELSTVDAMKANKIPVLFIHGTDDNFVPIEMTYENYSACSAPKELLVVPGADHGFSFTKEPLKYKKTVLDFWKKYDN